VAPTDGLRPPQLRIVTGSSPPLRTDAARRPQRQNENLKGAAEGISRHPTNRRHESAQTHPVKPIFASLSSITNVTAVSSRQSAISYQLSALSYQLSVTT
jgi:hypothetical protein